MCRCGLWFCVVMYLSVGAFACVGKCRPFRAHIILSVCTQGFLSGFALIPPWAMREYRPFRAHIILSVCTQGSVRAFGTLATLGYAGVPCLRHSLFEIIALRGTSKAEV